VTDGAAFKPHDDGLLDQGDILADVPFVRWTEGDPEEGTPRRGIITSNGEGIVTSNGCTCEDYERAIDAGRSSAAARVYVQVAPLRPAKDFNATKQQEIREGRHLDRFFVEGESTVLTDQIADLTLEQPFPASLLSQCEKIARVADWQWNALLIHLAVSRFHIKPERLFREELLTGGGNGA
jgi:hypothetical protein